MKTQYHLEIYEPDMNGCVAGHYKSDSPFGALSVGDEISGMSLNVSDRQKDLRIIKIQHIFWDIENSHTSHKICVWTELLDK